VEQQGVPPIVFVFGGGGARTAAVAGAAAALFDAGIKPDCIIGSSMGFVVGGLIAAGMHPQDVCRSFENGALMNAFLPIPPALRVCIMPVVALQHLLRRPPYDGLYGGRALRRFLNRTVTADRMQIEEWDIPVAASVFNLITGRAELIERGEFGLIASATTAVPALFRPVEIGDGLYLDGGVLENLPAEAGRRAADALGGGIVIAVNVNEPHHLELPAEHFRQPANATFRVMSAHYQVIDAPQEGFADVVIRAEVPMRMTSKNKSEISTAIAIGAGAAQRALPEIRRCIGDKSVRSGQMSVV
jgi:NTE family protein